MTVEALAAWMLAIMMTSVPPGKSRQPAAARETAEEGKARYAAIARAIALVSLDEDEAPLFAGKNGRAETATLMLAMSRFESTWRRDVDLGIGPRSRGAGGKYWCLMQIAVPKGKTPEGWTGRDLVKSRDKCFRRALHILQRGKRVCKKHGGTSFVNHYASGQCTRAKKAVKKRVNLMHRWLKKHPLPSDDKKRDERHAVFFIPHAIGVRSRELRWGSVESRSCGRRVGGVEGVT
jgi:hypothetical protein